MSEELRPVGPGRYAFSVKTPWGQAIPAELIVSTAAGWPERPEARDPRWSAYPVGPLVLAIRLIGGQPGPPVEPAPSRAACPARPAAPRLPASPVPAEWN